LSLLTAALAEATFASRVALLSVELEEEFELAPLSRVVFVLWLGEVLAGVVALGEEPVVGEERLAWELFVGLLVPAGVSDAGDVVVVGAVVAVVGELVG
jgi:hypothetical protein